MLKKITAFSVSPDHSQLAIGYGDGTIRRLPIVSFSTIPDNSPVQPFSYKPHPSGKSVTSLSTSLLPVSSFQAEWISFCIFLMQALIRPDDPEVLAELTCGGDCDAVNLCETHEKLRFRGNEDRQ